MKYTLVVSESQDTIAKEFQRIIGSLPVKSSIPYMKLHLPLVASRHQALGFEAWRAAVREHRKVTHDKWGKDHGRNHGKHLMHPFSPVYSGYSNSRYKHTDKLTWHSIYHQPCIFQMLELVFPHQGTKNFVVRWLELPQGSNLATPKWEAQGLLSIQGRGVMGCGWNQSGWFPKVCLGLSFSSDGQHWPGKHPTSKVGVVDKEWNMKLLNIPNSSSKSIHLYIMARGKRSLACWT